MPARFWLFALLAALPGWPQTRTYAPQPPAPENPELRREAVRLMERAYRASTPDRWVPHAQLLHIRVLAPSAGGPAEGDYRSYRASENQSRFETDFGDYHYVVITVNHQHAELGTPGVPPAVIDRARQMTPVFRGQFDNTDIIRGIHDATIDGQPARCIDFTSVAGEELQQNQVCVETARGVLLSVRQDNVTLLQSDFFEYAGALMPGRIVRLVDGAEELEIGQKLTAMSEFPPGLFEIPAGARTATVTSCKTFVRATAIDTPQPPPGPSNGIVEVVVRGMIDDKGHTTPSSVLESTRPDLNQAALDLVAKWSYEPARCDGHAVSWSATFRVQFKGY